MSTIKEPASPAREGRTLRCVGIGSLWIQNNGYRSGISCPGRDSAVTLSTETGARRGSIT